MARSRCTCGEIVLWKADEPQSDEWLLAAKPDLPDDLNDLWLNDSTGASAAFCRNCGRLWVAWGDQQRPAEYVPADPTVRPLRYVHEEAEPDDA
jgi:hypothetical protein